MTDTETAGWPPEMDADPLLIARSYMRANWHESAQEHLLVALIERLDKILERLA